MSTGCFLPYIGLGTCLLHMAYIHEFAKKEGPVTVLTFSKSLPDALKYDQNIKNVVVVQKFHKRFVDIFKLSQYLKSLNIKKLYIFKCSLRFNFASKLAGIYTKSYPFYKKNNLHLVKEAQKFTIKNIGLKSCPTETRLLLDKITFAQVKKNMETGKKNILIAPSSSGPTTIWKASYFVDLMKKLDNKLDCLFVIAVDSSDRERKISNEIIKSFSKEKIMLLSEKTISETMPIISCCNLSISNDTSFQHLSCQLNVPTIILRFDTPDAYSSYSKLQYPLFPDGLTNINHDTRADPALISVDKVLKKAFNLLNIF
jgi:ADP-heptose:LPS heptosyltransferase